MLKQWLFAPHKVLLSGYSPRILERRGCRQWGVPFQMNFGKSETEVKTAKKVIGGAEKEEGG